MKRVRVGLAILFSERNSTYIEGLRLGLGGYGVGRIPPHITLVPPSNLYLRDIRNEIYRLRCLAANISEFELVIGPADTFHPTSPVLYLSIAGNGIETLNFLQNRLSSPIYRLDDREFVPHVTLVDGIDEQHVIAARDTISSPVAVEKVNGFALLLSKAQGYWELSSDFLFDRVRKRAKGGLEVEIFRHSAGDFAIYDLATSCGVSPSFFYPACDSRFRFSTQENLMISIYHDGELIGCGSAVMSGSIGLVRSVLVSTERRGLGLAHLAIDELIFFLRQKGVDQVFIISNQDEIKFVQSVGAMPFHSGLSLFNYENGMTLNSWSFSSR